MKKITSIFSLALFSALTLSLSSCNECEGGESGWNPGDQGVTVDQLEKKLAEAAEKLVALSSDGSYVLSYDPVTKTWYYAAPGADGQMIKIPITPSVPGAVGPAGPAGPAGVTPKFQINGTTNNWEVSYDNGATWADTGVKATGPSGVTPKMQINGTTGNWEVSYDDGATWKDTGVKAQGPAGADGADGKSGVLDANGVYVNYDDNGTEKTIYIPKFTSNADGTTTINVGGTEYIIPKACECSITNNGDGSYTIKAGGKTETLTIPVVPAWVNTTQVTYNTTTGQFEISSVADPTQKVAIPNGYAELSIDATTGVATVTGSDGTTNIKLQKTQPVVISATDDSGAAWVINYGLDGTAIDTLKLPQFGQFTALTKKVGDINTDLTTLKSQVGTWDPAAHNGKTMAEAVDSIGNEVSALETKVSSMFETLMKKIAESITNIQVEEVMSNAIGSYNGILTNLKTTKLVGYVGAFQKTVMFPSDAAGGEVIPAGIVYSDTLGTIQLTVNPIGTNFKGVSVSLVNSLGQESSIKLSDLEPSDKLLTTGLTRADGSTGLYKTSATVSAGDIVNDSRLHMTVDNGAIKEAAKATWNDLKAAYNSRSLSAVQGETLNKVANAIYSVVNGIQTERLAVKTEWEQTATDPVSGNEVKTKKSIVSPYDLSGVVVKPLGFETLPEDTLIDKFKKLDNKAKKAISKLNTRIAKKIISTINENADLENIENQINDLQIKIKKVKPIPEDMKIIKQVVDIDTTITIKVPVDYTTTVSIDTVLALNVPVEVEFDAVVPKDFSFDETTHKVTVKEWGDLDKTVNVVTNINFVYSRDVRFQKQIETDVRFWIKKEFSFDMSDMVDNVNNALDVVTSVDGLCNSVQKIINNIYKMEDRLLAGNYLNRVYKFLDKASEYSAKGIYKLFQPVLLVNSDKGFGFAGIRGVPAEVSGKVEVIPTTYSNGLVAPVYKKYISVNGKPIKGSNGKYVHNDAVLDITSELKTGENIIEYYALDYHGQEKYLKYVVIKK